MFTACCEKLFGLIKLIIYTLGLSLSVYFPHLLAVYISLMVSASSNAVLVDHFGFLSCQSVINIYAYTAPLISDTGSWLWYSSFHCTSLVFLTSRSHVSGVK